MVIHFYALVAIYIEANHQFIEDDLNLRQTKYCTGRQVAAPRDSLPVRLEGEKERNSDLYKKFFFLTLMRGRFDYETRMS